MENQFCQLHVPMKMAFRKLAANLALFCVAAASSSMTRGGEPPHDPRTNDAFRTVVLIGDFPAASEYAYWFNGYAAEYRAELLPAEVDPAGNWGTATNGMQMSIRLYRTNFVVGEPVSAVVLWRNVGELPLPFFATGLENYTFALYAARDGLAMKPTVPRLKPVEGIGTGGDGLMRPLTQWRETVRLDHIFDLSEPGSYEVSAGHRTPHPLERRAINARSGSAVFHVWPKPDSGGGKPTTATNVLPPAPNKQ